MTNALTRVIVTVGGLDYEIAFNDPKDISIWLNFDGPQPNAFGLPRASSAPYATGSFVAAVDHGAGFNCDTVMISPHGNGTHTECVGHIVEQQIFVHEQLCASLMPATLLSVKLVRFDQTDDTYAKEAKPGDLVISEEALHEAFTHLDADPVWFDALILRTFPNDRGKCQANYTRQNPAYLTQEAMQWICKRGVQHLVLDLPSVDREEDSGALLNHHTFWHIPQGEHHVVEESLNRTITEMVWVEDALSDGHYLIDIQLPAWQTDAAPSRPLLYHVNRI